MDEDDSVNRVFADLENFLKRNNIKVRPGGTTAVPDFTEAMRGVRRISHDKEAIRRKRPKEVSLSPEPDARLELARVLSEDEPLNVTNLPEYMEGFAEGLSPLTMDRLRNGEFSVEKTLDLHGFHTDDAEHFFAAFLQGAIRDGLRCIKVIHGRGLKSKEKPVLKESLKTWIIKAINRKWIVAFASAKMADGGTGATYILLKGKPVKKRIHVMG
jgi:DNA-nicking Smr family endonuclease